jgi:hypothetical protein
MTLMSELRTVGTFKAPGLWPIVLSNPEDICSNPSEHFIKEVLPAPFCPRIANTPGAERSKFIPTIASKFACDFLGFWQQVLMCC